MDNMPSDKSSIEIITEVGERIGKKTELLDAYVMSPSMAIFVVTVVDIALSTIDERIEKALLERAKSEYND